MWANGTDPGVSIWTQEPTWVPSPSAELHHVPGLPSKAADARSAGTPLRRLDAEAMNPAVARAPSRVWSICWSDSTSDSPTVPDPENGRERGRKISLDSS